MAALPKIKEKIEDTIFISEIAESSQARLLKISFEESSELQPNRLKNIVFEKCIFSHQTINNISFLGCTFIDCQFNGTQIKNSEFHKCIFRNSCLYKTSFQDTYIDPNSFEFSKSWHRNWPNVNAWLFQNLYRNSKNMHQEKFAMHADNRFLFYKRYEYLYGQNPSKRKFIKGLLFDWVLGNGYGLINTVIISLATILTFALLIKDNIKQEENQNLLDSLYFAVVSFTTVGYGDISPNHSVFATFITIVFLVSSVVWGALMTAIIIKRIVK